MHSMKNKRFKEKVWIHFASRVFATYYLPMCRTIRKKVIHLEKYDKPHINAIWHGLQYSWLGIERSQRYKFNILVSPSNDGECIAKVCHWLGFSLIRGSVKRQGVSAVRNILRALKKGESVGYTVDGPKGPIYEVKEGVIKIAQMAQVPIIPSNVASDKGLEFNSWDKYTLPHWFAKSVMVYGEPIFIPKDATEDELEEYRLQLQEKLFELKAMAKEEFKKEYNREGF